MELLERHNRNQTLERILLDGKKGTPLRVDITESVQGGDDLPSFYVRGIRISTQRRGTDVYTSLDGDLVDDKEISKIVGHFVDIKKNMFQMLRSCEQDNLYNETCIDKSCTYELALALFQYLKKDASVALGVNGKNADLHEWMQGDPLPPSFSFSKPPFGHVKSFWRFTVAPILDMHAIPTLIRKSQENYFKELEKRNNNYWYRIEQEGLKYYKPIPIAVQSWIYYSSPLLAVIPLTTNILSFGYELVRKPIVGWIDTRRQISQPTFS